MISPKMIMCVVGARPNFMKIGPVIEALRAAEFRTVLVHTGQHYDAAMSGQLFADLRLPTPDINLDVGSGSHARQTAEIMVRFEAVLDEAMPDAILVVGDVNSTIACALVAAKKGVRIIHVEAGLRSYDRAMPEEINRVLTDQLSDFLFLTERGAEENLLKEGIARARMFFVGNVMIDTLLTNLDRAVPARQQLAGTVAEQEYALLTLHRPSNVDDRDTLAGLLDAIEKLSEKLPIVFPAHPRTKNNIANFGFADRLAAMRLVCLPPVGYLEMLGLMRDARMVLTDSGGLQEESTALGVPCLTLRTSTERPITITEGTNSLVGVDPVAIGEAADDILRTGGKRGRVPEFWDGKAGSRIAQILKQHL